MISVWRRGFSDVEEVPVKIEKQIKNKNMLWIRGDRNRIVRPDPD